MTPHRQTGPGLATPLLLLVSIPLTPPKSGCPGLATPLLLLGCACKRSAARPCPGLATPLLLLGYTPRNLLVCADFFAFHQRKMSILHSEKYELTRFLFRTF